MINTTNANECENIQCKHHTSEYSFVFRQDFHFCNLKAGEEKTCPLLIEAMQKEVCKDCPANVEEHNHATNTTEWTCTRYNMPSKATIYCPFKEANPNWNE